MAYTPPVFKTNPVSQTTAGNTQGSARASNFGNLRVDGSRNAMAGSLGNFMQTIDAAGTPVASPVTVNTTQTLKVPTNATQITIISTTNAVQVSEDSTQSAYFTLPAGIPWVFDCANMVNIYLKTASSTVVNFLFYCI